MRGSWLSGTGFQICAGSEATRTRSNLGKGSHVGAASMETLPAFLNDAVRVGKPVPETLGGSGDSPSVHRVMQHPATRILVEQSPPSAGFAPAAQSPMPRKSLSVNRLTGWSAVARPSFDRLRCRAWLWPCACGREPPRRVLATEHPPQHLHHATKIAKDLTAYPCSDAVELRARM